MYSPLQTILLDGLQIGYRTQGTGPDVMLIHGWASSSRMWQRLMDDLSSRFRCTALDLPGFGESDKPHDDWYSISRYTQLVADFANIMGLHQPAIIGHSMGGMIALAAAGDSILPVSRLVAINPVVTGRTYFDLRLLAQPRWNSGVKKFGHWVWPIATSDWMGPWFGAERAEHLRRTQEEWRQSTPMSLLAAARAIGQCDLSDMLAGIATPTLIVVGSRDLTAPPRQGKFAAGRIPGAQLAVLPSGHLPTDDMPKETGTVVSTFLGAVGHA
jgi:pimeloyl-ACP methyl ester carboxylesterase